MNFSFSINSKSQSIRLKKSSAPFSAAADHQAIRFAADASSTGIYAREFNPDEAPRMNESKIKTIAPKPNEWRSIKKLKNLPNLPSLSETNGSDLSLRFELDPGFNPEASDDSMAFRLNLRPPLAANGGLITPEPLGTISELKLRKLMEDLEKLREDTGMDEFTDEPVDGFAVKLLSRYGWKEGQGLGRRNAKEDINVCEFTKKTGRRGLGFMGEFSAQNLGNATVGKSEKKAEKEKKGFDIGKEVRIVGGREMGMTGKVVEVRRGGDTLVLRLSRKVKVRIEDVAELGSAEEENCLRKLKELRNIEESVDRRKGDMNPPRKTSRGEESTVTERVNWLRNHIRVRIISKELKGGRLFLKTGVVVDDVGPGMCNICMDESRELIQGVEQELLGTALPKCGGPVLVLRGRYEGVYGSLLECDSEKETGIVRDAVTQEMLNVRLEQIAEYTGDPSDIGY